MSPRAAPATTGGGGRVAVTVVAVIVLAVVMFVLLRARPGSDPFDPESGRPDGTRGLVLLLRQQGVTVDVIGAAPAVGDPGRVLVLDDRLDQPGRTALSDWIAAGGVAVVADAASPLVADLPTETVDAAAVPPPFLEAEAQANIERGACTIAALTALRGVFVRDGVVFGPPPGSGRCFEAGGDAFVVSRTVGAGVLVAVGDNELWTNALLRYADNAPLATALLAPQPGGAVHVLVGGGPAHGVSDVGGGEDTLADLVRPGVWMALLQLFLAFVVFAVARGVRPGRPVDEHVPAPVEGSELVAATGQLMQRAEHTSRAGWILRGATYRDLCRELRVPTTTPIDALDRLAAERGLTAAGEISAALGQPSDSPDQLVALANRLAELRDRTTEGVS